MERFASLVEKEINDKNQIFNIPPFSIIILIFGFITSTLCLYIFSELAEKVLANETIYLDHLINKFISSFYSGLLNIVMKLVTRTGSLVCLATLSAITFIWLWFYKKDAWVNLFFFITVAGGGILNRLLKIFFHRTRPSLKPEIDAVNFSFPSGHAMGSLIFYGFIGYLIIRSERKKISKIISTIFLAGFIFMIGISRIYLNVHYATDVIAGFCAGTLWLVICILALEFTNWYRKRKHLPNLDDEEVRPLR